MCPSPLLGLLEREPSHGYDLKRDYHTYFGRGKPMAAATVLAAAIGYGMSILTVVKLAPPGTPVPQLGHVYYVTMGAGLAIALIVIGVTLPLLKRMTAPDNARFD